MKRTIILSVEQAKELYNKDNSFRTTILNEFTDEELDIKPKLKNWEELGEFSTRHNKKLIKGYWISTDSSLNFEKNIAVKIENKNVFATEKQAQSALAMAQLSQLMADLGDECDVDWKYPGAFKRVIERVGNKVVRSSYTHGYHFLAFKTESVRDTFLEKHEELIKQYFMI